MKQAINAYHSVAASPEFREAERLRSIARHNEAAALRHARMEGKEEERQIWQSVVADKDLENEKLRSKIVELQSQIITQKK